MVKVTEMIIGIKSVYWTAVCAVAIGRSFVNPTQKWPNSMELGVPSKQFFAL
jgi:hypothetical protein